jgi:hypothetical protein
MMIILMMENIIAVGSVLTSALRSGESWKRRKATTVFFLFSYKEREGIYL